MKKVLVAMSGGVDSSVAAALLKKQGYLVTGGFMKNFSPESWAGVVGRDCPWEDDWRDVQKVSRKLGISCRSFNFEKEYSQKVVDYFFAEYRAGRTPNPDIMCNKEIKFGLFLKEALRLGFDYVASGHYARLRRELPISNFQFPKCRLLKGVDPQKDQSYFLYNLTQKQLSRVLFPIGGYAKPEVRKLAKHFALPNAGKKDSQGLCFVGRINLREFLKTRLSEKKGEIVDLDGHVIGTHPGAWFYTIGQRRGIGVGGGKPYYVAEKLVRSNKLIVSSRVARSPLCRKVLKLRKPHWIGEQPRLPLSCRAKIRYQQIDQVCVVKREKNGLVAKFAKPQFAPAPGQSVVFYQKDAVLGGAIIY